MDDFERPQKSWWGRNWFWVVPLGCLSPIIIVIGCAVAGFFAIEGMLKSSDAYTFSKAAVLSDANVRAALGEPIETGMMVGGKINLTNNGGHADINYTLKGPKSGAEVHAVADKQAGKWAFSRNHVVVDATNQEIDVPVTQ
jgi:hypothetical protein